MFIKLLIFIKKIINLLIYNIVIRQLTILKEKYYLTIIYQSNKTLLQNYVAFSKKNILIINNDFYI